MRRLNSSLSDTALEWVMPYLDDPGDRSSVSLVCKKWHQIDALTRKHVTVATCYSTSPVRLRSRFPNLESLKIKGKPRAAMFDLVPEDWGGRAEPWIREISDSFHCLKFLHLRRMIVTDDDLGMLTRGRNHMLQVLKLDKCSGFSTNGLLEVARSCRFLRNLFLEESKISDTRNGWIRELALNNSVLEVLNFYMTDLNVNIQDLELLARNCRSLVSLKVSECEILYLDNFFRAAEMIKEFGGGSFNQVGEGNIYENVHFPPSLSALGLIFLSRHNMSAIFPCAASLKQLDLQYTCLDMEDHCQLIQRFPSLEVLEVTNIIGDRGLEVVAQHCRKLRRLRVEWDDDQVPLHEHVMVSQRGLSAIARGCPDLEYLAVYVSDISNEALECFGTYSKNLHDFRLVLLDKQEKITDLPLDNGVAALLQGCQKIRRFALYLRHGGLTDVGLGYIGRHGTNIKWLLLGYVGQTDAGLLELSRGCPSLLKLEMRGCFFSMRALALAVTNLVSLRYIWVQGCMPSGQGNDLLLMARPFWNVEIIPTRQPVPEFARTAEEGAEQPAQVLAYYALDGRRTDFAGTVITS
ncbi:coronatine-insensitive protein homolog 2-like [Nymphaea colorata]|nr:coronatine-insensitive protein homolog 2-like [Nymphaea colorata]XP_031488191.1 coronatine-insensitive protein homolog 2-like [Nymphaea colorata]